MVGALGGGPQSYLRPLGYTHPGPSWTYRARSLGQGKEIWVTLLFLNLFKNIYNCGFILFVKNDAERATYSDPVSLKNSIKFHHQDMGIGTNHDGGQVSWFSWCLLVCESVYCHALLSCEFAVRSPW